MSKKNLSVSQHINELHEINETYEVEGVISIHTGVLEQFAEELITETIEQCTMCSSEERIVLFKLGLMCSELGWICEKSSEYSPLVRDLVSRSTIAELTAFVEEYKHKWRITAQMCVVGGKRTRYHEHAHSLMLLVARFLELHKQHDVAV